MFPPHHRGPVTWRLGVHLDRPLSVLEDTEVGRGSGLARTPGHVVTSEAPHQSAREMASVARDLSVQVHEDINLTKLTERQRTIKKGETKSMGVSQMMLGLMVMSYSIPLHFTEHTEVVTLGVPWWSGISYIMAGAVTIFVEKQCTSRTLGFCLMMSSVSTVASVVALIIYSVDLERNPEFPCVKSVYNGCDEKYYAGRISRGVKSSLLLFTLVQTVLSSILCFLLYREKRTFEQYSHLDAQSTPAAVSPGVVPASD